MTPLARLRALAPLLLRPPALLGLLVFMAGLYSLVVTPLARPRAPLQQVALEQDLGEDPEAEEVTVVVSDPNDLPRSVVLTVALPSEETARLEAILAALRDYLAAPRLESPDGPLWPEALTAPRVFVVERGVQNRHVVLDFRLLAPVQRTVAQELRLLASIRRTVRLHAGTDGVSLLLAGRPSPSLLGNVAQGGSLD